MKVTQDPSGASSSRSSTPQTVPEDDVSRTTSRNSTPLIHEEVMIMKKKSNGHSAGSDSIGSIESTGSVSSIPASPASTKSASSNGLPSSLGTTDLNLNMSVSQMRAMLAKKREKKDDPKKAGIDLRQKYEIIQQM